ncbi:MAG: peptidase S11 [Comamonadaceae bacterium]|nr:MAG: peptidase S11 [Comamonadaceae bacterium]
MDATPTVVLMTAIPADPPPQPAQPQPAKVEDVAVADTENAAEQSLPRRSAAHARGLHKTEDALGLGSSAAMVVDAATRQVVFAKNEEAVLPIASLTKLMAGLVLAEARLPMDETITITDDDIDLERHSRSRLNVGTVLTRDEALRLALMSSENRAAHALGRTWPLGKAAFVAAMNAKARQLGMTNTSYVDPTGLSSGNRSSARDLTALAVAAARHELLRAYSTTPEHLFDAGERPMRYRNSNRLVRNPHWDIALQKTGYIIEAGHCVVMRARVAGRDLVMVLLDAGDNTSRAADADRIRHWLDPRAALAEREAATRAAAKTASQAERRQARRAERRSAPTAQAGRVRRSFNR